MQGFFRLLRWIVVLGALVGGGYALKETVLAPKPVVVQMLVIERGVVESTVTNSRAGTVRSRQRARISPEISGRIVEIPLREGRAVEQGDVVLRLAQTTAEAALAVARKSLATAEAEHAEVIVRRDLARHDLERKVGLYETGGIQEDVVTEYRNRHQILERTALAAAAAVEGARATVDQARAELDKTVVRAPFDGIVTKVWGEVGELATPMSSPGRLDVSAGPVLEIVNLDRLYVSAEIDEVDMGRLEVDQPVRITLDPYPDRSFDGTVVRVAQTVSDVQEKNRTVEVEVEFVGTGEEVVLRPGTSADVEVILESRAGVVRLPSHVLLEGDRVLVLEAEHLASRAVRIGLRNWDFAEVVSGLQVGDQVVTNLDREEIREGVWAVEEGAEPGSTGGIPPTEVSTP